MGAFVGNECRGVGVYVNGLLYITIHGTIADNESVSFKAHENVTGMNWPIIETITMDGMQTGTLSNPYELHASISVGIDEIGASLNIYPNPVRDVMYINSPTPILDVKILAASGKVVFSSDHYSVEGINVSSLLEGVYVVAIHTPTGYQYRKILKVK